MGSWEPQIEEQTMQDQKKKTRNGPKHITLKTKDWGIQITKKPEVKSISFEG
jgi:hypothetical protein